MLRCEVCTAVIMWCDGRTPLEEAEYVASRGASMSIQNIGKLLGYHMPAPFIQSDFQSTELTQRPRL
jgi:hypothetical protein